MFDLHCHILPGVDDGVASIDEAMAMARFYLADGVTHVVATPHCNRGYRNLRADILPRVQRLNEDLSRAGVPLTVLPGSEIQVHDSALYRREFEAGIYCHLGDRPSFTLLEFSWREHEYPADAADLVRYLGERGTTPILAHPERYRWFAKGLTRLSELVVAGAWLQITVDSILGNHGTMPQTAAEAMLRLDAPTVLASDAHNLQRCSGLAAGFAWVTTNLGPAKADELRGRAVGVLSALESRL